MIIIFNQQVICLLLSNNHIKLYIRLFMLNVIDSVNFLQYFIISHNCMVLLEHG